MTIPGSDSGAVTTRELYAQLAAIRTEVNARFDKVDTALESKFKDHELEHAQEERRRSSLMRWAVTTIMGLVLGTTAIVVPIVVH